MSIHLDQVLDSLKENLRLGPNMKILHSTKFLHMVGSVVYLFW
jgi:hypothetical protein